MNIPVGLPGPNPIHTGEVTGINTPPGFPHKMITRIAESTGIEFREASNHFEAQGGGDSLVELSGQLRTLAVGLTKICNDLRWMSSGPTTGLGEVHLPDLQPGSSIMPGKVNRVCQINGGSGLAHFS